MNVHGLGPAVAPGAPAGRSKGSGSPTQGVGTNDDTRVTGQPEGSHGSEPPRAKGVLGLLQAGHFKGVADVRLRINLFDELSALKSANLAEAAGVALPDLKETVAAEFSILLESGELDPEQTAAVLAAQETFNTVVDEAMQDVIDSGGTDSQDVFEEIRLAFDVFLEDLAPIITALMAGPDETPVPEEGTGVAEAGAPGATPADEAVAIETASDVPEDAVPSSLAVFLDNLRAVFEEAILSTETAFEAADPLPALSEPSGNGGAFDKFLAILNELQGSGDETQTTAEDAFTTIA